MPCPGGLQDGSRETPQSRPAGPTLRSARGTCRASGVHRRPGSCPRGPHPTPGAETWARATVSRGRGHETSAQEEDGVPTGLLSGWDTNVSLGPCPVPRTRADSSRTPRTTPVSASGRPRVLLPTDLDVPPRRCEVGDRDSVTPVSPKLPNAHTQIINPPWSEPPRASRHVLRPGQWRQVRGAAPGVSADTHRHSPVTQRVQGPAMRPPPRPHAAVTGCSRAVTHIHTPLPARHGDRWAPHTRTLDAWGVRAPWVGDGRWVTAPCPPRGGAPGKARPTCTPQARSTHLETGTPGPQGAHCPGWGRGRAPQLCSPNCSSSSSSSSSMGGRRWGRHW